MKVSVIICAYSEERLPDIREAVQSVLAQTVQPHEVIVAVDHNESLLCLLKKELPKGVAVVSNTGARGLSDNRNAGIIQSTGDIVAFMDDDAVADGVWLERLVGNYHDRRVAAVGGRVVPRWTAGERPGFFPEELDWIVGCTYKGLPLNDGQCRNMIGCNMSFRRSCFDHAGLFSIEVGRIGRARGVGEEAAICLRIVHSMPGSLIVFEPMAVTHHKVPSWRVTLGYMLRRSYEEGFYKTIVKKLSPEAHKAPLSTENKYLRYLLLTAFPQKLAHFYKATSIAQAGAIVTCVVATGVGYAIGVAKGLK